MLVPRIVPTLRNITAFCGGYKHTVLLRGGEKLLAMGDNFFGQLGPIRSAVATSVDELDDDDLPLEEGEETTALTPEQEPIILLAAEEESEQRKSKDEL